MPYKKYVEIEEIISLLIGGDGGKENWGNRSNYKIWYNWTVHYCWKKSHFMTLNAKWLYTKQEDFSTFGLEILGSSQLGTLFSHIAFQLLSHFWKDETRTHFSRLLFLPLSSAKCHRKLKMKWTIFILSHTLTGLGIVWQYLISWK